MSDFYDINLPLASSIKEDKSPVDIDVDIILCDPYEFIILKSYCKIWMVFYHRILVLNYQIFTMML